ncbi:pyruvate kinase [Coprothermobacteraceae bacterium]|nr:pyruvate kinase [Coprothermobacteraceae bacterium]
MRLVKIVATTGPALESIDQIRQAVNAGADVFRLNLSHGTLQSHATRIANIRSVEEEVGRPIAILADLQGPKIRIGQTPPEGVALKEGSEVKIVPGEGLCSDDYIYVAYEYLLEDVPVGGLVYLDDGKVQLQVKEKSKEGLVAVVRAGGVVTSRKGISFAGAKLRLPCLTEKDLEDIAFIVDQDVDFVALSFVRDPDDVWELRRRLDKAGRKDLAIIAKIERHEALEQLDGILEVADGLMVARGDLALDMPLEDLALVQKEIVRAAVERGRSVIVATQMLDSMMERPFPGRAEITDVANAVLDGADAVMLSGETAFGKYPILAIETMSRIITATQSYQQMCRTALKPRNMREALIESAVRLAERGGARLLVVATETGASARITSAFRSTVPVLAVTASRRLSRQLCLSRGVLTLLTDGIQSAENMLRCSVEWSLDKGLADRGDLLVYVFGDLAGIAGSTNSVKLYAIPSVVGRCEVWRPTKGTLMGRYVKRLCALLTLHEPTISTVLLDEQPSDVNPVGNVVWTREPEDGAVITIDLQSGLVYHGHYLS